MLRLLLLRGPLPTEQKLHILAEYNRLSSNHVPLRNFERWTEQSPAGPAAHALLENEDALVVGHCCVLPLPMQSAGQPRTGGKAEYLFLNEGFRNHPVSGFEDSSKPAVLLLLERLYQFCADLEWIPILASAPKEVQVLHRMAGCKPLNFALNECLFILRPERAARLTPSVCWQQRTALFLAGAGQRLIAPFLGGSSAVRIVPLDAPVLQENDARLNATSFSWSPEFLRWRYPPSECLRLELEGSCQGILIVKTQSEAGYFRVCQTELESPAGARSLAKELIGLARARKATGVRWAVYGESEAARRLVSELRRLGFLCAPRVRNLGVYSTGAESAEPEDWAFCDSFFAFDY